MSELPPLLRDQRKIDRDHLRILTVFHFIIAGFSLVGIGFLGLHYAFVHAILAVGDAAKGAKGNVPPAALFTILNWFYLVAGIMILIGGIANLLSAMSLHKVRYRTLSLVVAGLDLLCIPLGTVLGAFTLIVLLRGSVRELYDAPPEES